MTLRRGVFPPPGNPFLRSPRPLPAGRENGAPTDGIWDGFPGAETGRFWPSRRAGWSGFRGRKWVGKMLPKCRTSIFSAAGKMLPKCRTSAVPPPGKTRLAARPTPFFRPKNATYLSHFGFSEGENLPQNSPNFPPAVSQSDCEKTVIYLFRPPERSYQSVALPPVRHPDRPVSLPGNTLPKCRASPVSPPKTPYQSVAVGQKLGLFCRFLPKKGRKLPLWAYFVSKASIQNALLPTQFGIVENHVQHAEIQVRNNLL